MKTVNLIDWAEVDKRVTGLPLDEAVQVVCAVLVEKVNELTAEYNKHVQANNGNDQATETAQED